MNWDLEVADASFTPVTYVPASPYTMSSSGWTYQVGSYTVPASGVAYVKLYCQIYLATSATVARFDDDFITAGTQYYHQDQLSNRLFTDVNGNNIGQQGHFPFGENWYSSGNVSDLQFTTYERGAESGNDYAMARFYPNRLGRFMSPDPLGNFVGDPANPQSWNMYSYTFDNPMSFVDPTGLTTCDQNGDNCFDPSVPASGTPIKVDVWCCSIEIGPVGGGSGAGGAPVHQKLVPPKPQSPAPTGAPLDKNSCAARLAKGVQQHMGMSTSDPVFTQTRGGHANYGFTVDDPATFQTVLNQSAPWPLPFGLDTGHRYGTVQSTHILDPAAPGAPFTGHTDLFNGHSVLLPLHLLIDVAIGHIPGVNLDFGCHQ